MLPGGNAHPHGALLARHPGAAGKRPLVFENYTVPGESKPRDARDEPLSMDRAWGDEAPGERAAMNSHRVESLTGAKLVGETGEAIGDVEAIVRSQTSAELEAVVSVGGFLGIGDKEVTVPLRDLQMHGMDLSTPLARTEQQLKQRPIYREALYERLPGEAMVILGSAGETKAGEELSQHEAERDRNGVSYNELDANRDGRLSKEETDLRSSPTDPPRASGEPADRSEFSALEDRRRGHAESESSRTTRP